LPDTREGHKGWAGVHALAINEDSLGLAANPAGTFNDFYFVSGFSK
jgi:hypothetical protein